MNIPFTSIKMHESIVYKKPDYCQIEYLQRFFLSSLQDNFSYFPQEARTQYTKSWDTDVLLSIIQDENGLLYCACMHEEIIGVIYGNLPEGGVGSIIWLMVHPEYQNKKIGSRLLLHAKHFYQKQNAHKIKLTVQDERAMKFYVREGFIIEAHHKRHWWELDFWAMGYFIKPARNTS